MRDLSTSCAAKVVQEDTHKNVDEKTILCNIHGHLKSSKCQFLVPAAILGYLNQGQFIPQRQCIKEDPNVDRESIPSVKVLANGKVMLSTTRITS
jgi:hypothetical protein